MQAGIIGLPNAGKSTIFNALTTAHAAVANYPFCTIEPNTGFVSVPDENLVPLSKIYGSEKITNASIRVVDVAGLVEGASRGEGLGNKFLGHIREVDVIVHVVRCFHDENVSHSADVIDPVNDVGIVNTELILADLEVLHKKREKYHSAARTGDLHARNVVEVLDFLTGELNEGRIPFLPGAEITSGPGKKDPQLFKELNLLSLKPVLYISNLGEASDDLLLYEKLKENIKEGEVLKIYGKIENELAELNEEERDAYRKEMGLPPAGLNDFILRCYRLLNLITFYTINENEARAWSIEKDSRVIEAAGKIHTDMQKGFIKTEVINCAEILATGSIHRAREEGKLRIEGRDYRVKDRDVIQIKFAV
ncbi:MAG: redox-regulated ATPase YchF [Actinobacteria bacterium]|nr:redox-regulated ATPase YchF [Actinomycetota bacterium]